MYKYSSLPSIIYCRSTLPDWRGKTVVSFVDEHGRETRTLSWEQLHHKANRLAALLRSHASAADRVMLMYQQDIDFVIAFVACMYAQLIAVPVNPPRKKQTSERLTNILDDAQCALVLSTPEIHEACMTKGDDFKRFESCWQVHAQAQDLTPWLHEPPATPPDSIALLQYTSGSTGQPKGVMVSHANLAHNSELIRQSFGLTTDSCMASWLPMFHDMGLIGNVLQTLYTGCSCVLMSPAAFLRSPALWLKSISSYQATHAGAPNFGYEHACRRITDADLDGVDLRSWRVAFCGAEPIRKRTFDQFKARFQSVGFSARAYLPTYGMAEATLAVTAAPPGREPLYQLFGDPEQPDSHRSDLVSCGRPGLDTTVTVVDPNNLRALPDGEVGEIWVRGPGVAHGYWHRPEQTEAVFKAHLSGNGEGPFLRTGDLGYVNAGELYVTGRLSDLIIIRGRNHYPQDIEHAVEAADPAFAHGGVAAFSVQTGDEEQLIVLVELRRTAFRQYDKTSLNHRVRQVLSEEFGLTAGNIVLLKPGRLLKTSSGKVQRRACKVAYLAGKLDGVLESLPQAAERLSAAVPNASSGAEAIALQMRDLLAKRLKCASEQLDMTQPLSHFGMDSVAAAEIALEVEDMFGLPMSPTDLFDHPDIRALASYVNHRLNGVSAVASATTPTPGSVPLDHSDHADHAIAVVGMAAQFPGAPDIDTFWRNLLEGRDSVVEAPQQRWPLDDFFDPDRNAPGRSYSKWGGFIDDVDAFDPQFFNISPREAELMDPQQRLLLQQAWRALEHAGYPDRTLSGSACSLFIGCSDGDYRHVIERAGMTASAYTLMGNAASILAARIAYFLNLRGMCTTVDTACSSSLVAIHLACENLRSGQSDMSLAGGVCVLSTSQFHVLASKASMLSPHGRCRTFDQDADGFVPAEGVGVVVLKRLADAQRDGDTIHAVIRATGSNQDGRSNGITAPNGQAQTELIAAAYRRAGINARHIGLVEAHGTGTRLGDPIEVSGLAAAFRQFTPDTGFCAIGSVKTNIGHALAAAGVAGLIKAVLAVREGKLPASLHAATINPHIDFVGSPFYPLQRTRDWPNPTHGRRMAAISSFGFSGTNAHVVLEAPPPISLRSTDPLSPQLLVLSAKTATTLRQRALDLQHWLRSAAGSWSLQDVAGTLAQRRSHFSCRLAVVAFSLEDAQRQLGEWLDSAQQVPASAPNASTVDAAYSALDATPDKRPEALQTLAADYGAGADVDWPRVFPTPCAHVPLPTYPFAKERYWAMPIPEQADALPVPEPLPPSAEPGSSLPIASLLNTSQPSAVLEHRARLESDVAAAVARVLKLDVTRVDTQADLREFGFDSINITELTDVLNRHYGIAMTPPQLFEHRNLALLIDFLLETHSAEIHAKYAQPTEPQAMAAELPVLAQPAALPATTTAQPGGALDEPIAIVGIAGSFPGAEDLAVFWQRLMAGDDLISEVPPDRWDWRRNFGSAMEKAGQTKVKWGGFMPAVDRFDAAFFGISRREANLMDPQHRLFLQTAWHAIEDAGYAPAQLSGTRTGVFAGIFTADYNELLINSGHIREAHAITGLAHSMLPNRLSYLLNLHGPSVPVDTACSSSLVALHMAVESIRNGSSDMALVGGVNVMVSQTPFLSASRAGMICDDGRCKSFDRRANGYARGEGVGVVLVKPLSRALADHDHIYALIKGTAVNHGGAANSLTSPNPQAQADLIRTAMKRAGLPPSRMTYIEAHGTGTSLGDPIEINALKKAYRDLHDAAGLPITPRQCAIGTVKSQIGHLEAAAGVAGLLKVVLSLQQKRLHGNLHLQEPNPYIDLTDSPFYLITGAQDWVAQRDAEGDPLPRCASVSSFGFGGANAHVVLQEWPQHENVAHIEAQPQLILLSAPTQPQLEQAARALHAHLARQAGAPVLRNIAYTLQCGRTHGAVRLALICDSVAQLMAELDAFGQGCSSGRKAVVPLSATPIDVGNALQQRDQTHLAQAWLSGSSIDWQALWREQAPHRVPLPGHPFATERYWIPASPLASASIEPAKDRAVSHHPLAGQVPRGSTQTVTLNALDPKGYYFEEHLVAGQPVLPAAAMIELMRAAAEQALSQPVRSLSRLSWLAPVTPTQLGSGLRLVLSPVPDAPDQITLVLESLDAKGRVRVHSEGLARVADAAPTEHALDLPTLAQQCAVACDVDTVYQRLRQSGLAYGPAFRALSQLHGSPQASLAQLQLPASLPQGHDACVLSPSLLDAAFQAVVGVLQGGADPAMNDLLVPFSAGEIEIVHALPPNCVVHARLRGTPSARRGWNFDIDLADPQGKVLVRVRDLNLRPMRIAPPDSGSSRAASSTVAAAPTAAVALPAAVAHTWITEWEPTSPIALDTTVRGSCLVFDADLLSVQRLQALAPGLNVVRVEPHPNFIRYADDHFGLCGDTSEDFGRLLSELNGSDVPSHVIYRWTDTRPAAWPPGLSSVFQLVKALSSHPGRLRTRLVVVAATPDGAPVPAHAAIAGLLKSAAREHPQLTVRMLEFCGVPVDDERVLAELLQAGDTAQEVRYVPMGRTARRITAWQPGAAAPHRGLVPQAVYWITGGLGGIGLILARHLATHYQARIVLSGRRPADASMADNLAEIERLGGQALYVAADVTDAASLAGLVRQANERFGPIQGVFHSAGVLRDGFIRGKTAADMSAVLAPKTRGLMQVDQAVAGQPLDFFAAFSSVTGVVGNMGQCCYAAANAFMDAYMALRKQRSARGHSVSINWPLWADGGMKVADGVRKMLASVTGMELLDGKTAMGVLESALRQNAEQLIVATGRQDAIHGFLTGTSAAQPRAASLAAVQAPAQLAVPVPGPVLAPTLAPKQAPEAVPVAAAPAAAQRVATPDLARLRRGAETFLIETFANAVGLSVDEVQADTPFQNLGVDSFIVLQLLTQLEQDFGPLPKTLLFENYCVADLAEYFTTHHLEALQRKLGISLPTPEPVLTPASPPAALSVSAVAMAPQEAASQPVLMNESALHEAAPAVQQAVNALTLSHGAESSALGRGNFAPFIFLGASREGLFYCNRKGTLFVAFGYLGPNAYLSTLLSELEEHCAAQGLDLYVIEDGRVLSMRSDEYSATPFAVLQRVSDLPSFTTDGGAMRRLRYQASRFDKEGGATTCEYEVGSDAAMDARIVELIERWCQQKVMVNPYIDRLVVDLRQGKLAARHRAFLTHLHGTLQNVIIVSEMPSHGGWLMDCEFYPADMPLGGLEFAIIAIIEQLKRERARMFSLGITWGAQVQEANRADAAAGKVLAELAERGIFDGRGNLQFKNKFRPENTQIYLYKPNSQRSERVLEVILLIANSKVEQSREAPSVSSPPHHRAPHDRAEVLAAAGLNPANIDANDVEFDLATDSWAKLQRPWVRNPAHTYANLRAAGPLRAAFPFANLVTVRSGDEAERCLWQALQASGKRVLQNLMFPSFIYNEVTAGYQPEEIAITQGAGMGSLIDVARLRAELEGNAGSIGAVCIELLTNAAGGSVVPLAHLREVKTVVAPLGIPLVLDATRILDNAVGMATDEGDDQVWDQVRQICALADVLTASLTKNFGVTQGGLVATNDHALYERVRQRAQTQQLVLDQAADAALAAALSDPAQLLAAVRQRGQQVSRLAAALRDAGWLSHEPVGHHAVLIDVSKLPVFAQHPHPRASLLHHLYEHTGVRGGIHSAGIRRQGPLSAMVRLAVPVGMPQPVFEELLRSVTELGPPPQRVATLELVSKPNTFASEVHARYVARADTPLAVPAAPAAPTVTMKSARTERMAAKAEDIAIIGVAGRYPQADTLEDFWRNLLSGRDCIEQRPLARWNEPLPIEHGRIPATRWGGFINDIDKFDSMFFGISPKEVALLDPQERLFMEIAWATLEDAGYTPESLVEHDSARKVGVYVGAVWQLYQLLGAEQTQRGNVQTPNSLMWSIANRVSAFMNFTGPSLTVDTACSGSLASIYLACQAIRNGECSAAIAGGVNLDLHASKWLLTHAGGFLSPDGRCKAFGKGANGYVAGEGLGAVLLKPLSLAVADGDNIRAVIKSCTFNHGGRASGYAVPNPNAQADLIASAIEAAGVSARTINYIETHGTGTQLGDPIEVQGLTDAMRRHTDAQGFCAIGSVKTNIGHLEAAAGIAGLTKVLLQMRHRTLVPSLHCDEPNELIAFNGSPFHVQTKACPWEPVTVDGTPHPLRAGISSFGAGGANLHLIVEEPPVMPTSPGTAATAGPWLVVLSAQTEEQLGQRVAQLAVFLDEQSNISMDDLAYTLMSGRQAMNHRLSIVADGLPALRDTLAKVHAGKLRQSGTFSGNSRDAKAIGKLLEAEEIERLANEWIDAGRLDKLGQAWAQGLLGDLRLLAGRRLARRVSLPTYPFAKVSHWLKQVETTPTAAIPATLHPLLDRRDSSGEGMCFAKGINTTEYLYTDHIVADHATLPGVAYIEMACAAHREALGQVPMKIRNLVWAAPINSLTSGDIRVQLKPGEESTLCEITTGTAEGGRLVHAQAKLFSGVPQPPAERLDLQALRARLDRHATKAQCYALLGRLQFRYGECFQSIDSVDHNDTEALTRLVLPKRLLADFDRYHLHPSLMDGAIQSVISVVQNESVQDKALRPYVPFVAAEIDIYHPLTPICYAHVRLLRGARDVESIKKVDLTVADEQGRVLVVMRGFAFKAFSFEEISLAMGGQTRRELKPAPPLAAIQARPQEKMYLCSAWES